MCYRLFSKFAKKRFKFKIKSGLYYGTEKREYAFDPFLTRTKLNGFFR